MSHYKTKTSASLKEEIWKKAEQTAMAKAKRLEKENEELRQQLAALDKKYTDTLAMAKEAKAQAARYDMELCVAREELQERDRELQALRASNQDLRASNESREKAITTLIATRDTTPKRDECLPCAYPASELDEKIIRKKYDPDQLKNAIGILTSDMVWHRKYWFALYRLFVEHKVTEFTCTAAEFARWVEDNFPAAGQDIAKAMKSFQPYCKKHPIASWIEDNNVIHANRLLAQHLTKTFLDKQGHIREEYKASKRYDPTPYEKVPTENP